MYTTLFVKYTYLAEVLEVPTNDYHPLGCTEEKHAVIKVPWASHEAGDSCMSQVSCAVGQIPQKGHRRAPRLRPDGALFFFFHVFCFFLFLADSEMLDEAGGTKMDEADSEKLDEAGGSKMDEDEQEEVPPKIEGGTSGDPNEPTKTDQGEVQVDEEMASPQDGANSEEKDSTDDSSKETSSQQGQGWL